MEALFFYYHPHADLLFVGGGGVSALDLVTILAIFANLVLTRSEPCRATPYSLPCHLVAVLS